MRIKKSYLFWRNCLIGSFIGLLSGVLLSACSSDKKDSATLENFSVTNPIVIDTIYTSEYVADIHSIQNVEIRAKASGYLESLHVDEGRFVKEGQLLFSINSQQYRQELLKAQAALASALADSKAAEVELNNVKTLVSKNIVSQSEQDLAEAKLEAFKAKIEEAKAHESNAKLQLSFAQIKAPFSGLINRIPFKTGSLVNEGSLLTTISNNKEVFAYFNLSEKDYLDYMTLSPGEKSTEATLLLANNTLYQHKGKIETIESEFEKSTGNIAFRAKFPNPENLLKHGGSGKVLLKTELKNAMLIPQKSTFEVQENIYVFVVTEGNIVQPRKIVPSFRLPQLYVISSGLAATDKFVYEGIQKLKDGDVIVPESVSPNSYKDLSVNPTTNIR
jgi:RND family efflux transporter MFP subunit